jgi:Amt family ammonium transporter
MNTNTAGLSGAIIVAIIMQIMYKKLDLTMILNGALGGLVAITAGPDLYDIYTPILIGAIGGCLVVLGVSFFDKIRIDDPVGALSVHLVNGIWGTIAVGIFASNGDDITLLGQLKGILLIGIFAFVSSYIILYIINKIMPLRAGNDEEMQGLDVEECGLEAYPEFKRAF